jgi:hypothetical protein
MVREPVDDLRIDQSRVLRTGKEQAMGQQIRPWRSGFGEMLWLSMLIDTMEAISMEKGLIEKGLCRERGAVPCDQVLADLRSQLARPAAPCLQGLSPFSLRN